MPTLVLTLQLDPEAQAFFENLRGLYFPAARNQVPAHLTLLHQLPHTEEVMATLQRLAGSQSRFPLPVVGLRSLGRGVAYEMSSPVLSRLHASLCAVFADSLIAQDRQRYQPHVVVQNKATPVQAQTLLAQLKEQALPPAAQGWGLHAWQYLGGPWEHLETFAFASDS